MKWTDEKETILRDSWEFKTVKELAKILNVSEASIWNKARVLDLGKRPAKEFVPTNLDIAIAKAVTNLSIKYKLHLCLYI